MISRSSFSASSYCASAALFSPGAACIATLAMVPMVSASRYCESCTVGLVANFCMLARSTVAAASYFASW